MKRLSILIGLTFLYSTYSNACDYCNCYLGLNPHYKKNTIGVRYYQSDYTGTHHYLYEFNNASLTKKDFVEKRMTTEIYAQWFPVQKLQVFITLPYIYNMEIKSSLASAAMNNHEQHSHTHSGNEDNSNKEEEPVKGLGDPVMLAQYQVFNRSSHDSSSFSQRLFLGGGLSIPLGRYKSGADSDPQERTHLPGAGSFGFLINSSWLAKKGPVGCNVNISYMIKNQNDEQFQLGNSLNGNMIFYYQINNHNFTIYPSAGLYYEKGEKDRYRNDFITNSSAGILSGHSGLDFYYNRFSVSVAFEIPINEQINLPQPELDYKIIAGIGYALN